MQRWWKQREAQVFRMKQVIANKRASERRASQQASELTNMSSHTTTCKEDRRSPKQSKTYAKNEAEGAPGDQNRSQKSFLVALGRPGSFWGRFGARSGRPQERPERHLGRHESHLGRQVGHLGSHDGAFGVQVGRPGRASECRRALRRFSVDFGVSHTSSEVLKS